MNSFCGSGNDSPKVSYDISLENGKYRFVYYEDGQCEVFRHGQPWPPMTETARGSKAIMLLVARIAELESQVAKVFYGGRVEYNVDGTFEAGPLEKTSAYPAYPKNVTGQPDICGRYEKDGRAFFCTLPEFHAGEHE